MRSWVLAACLIAAAAAPPALAADMDDGGPPPKGGYYDAPRYQPKGPPPPYHGEEDDDDGPRPPNKFTGPPPQPYGKCVRSEHVRERLTGMGWNDFHEGRPVNEQAVTLRARRPNGRLFELTLDRCSGQIVDARPLEPRRYGPYADKGPYEPYGQRRSGPYQGYDRPWFDRPYAYRWPRRWHRDREDY
jgi:hypothetical protein